MNKYLNHFKNMDCVDFVAYLKQNNIKAKFLLTDPPYNISKYENFLGRTMDFGEGDKGFDLTGGIKLIDDIVDKDGSVVIFNAGNNLGLIAEELSKCGFDYKTLITGSKPNPWPRNMDRKYVSSDEYAIGAVKRKAKGTFNKGDVAYLRPVFSCSPPRGKNRIHTTQKPQELLTGLINTHTNKNDVVVDLFGGSGSTVVAAFKAGRIGYGCEKDSKIYNDGVAGALDVEGIESWIKK